MKKILLVFVNLLNVLYSQAQSCPNGGFENWYLKPYVVPDTDWYDSNPQSIAISDTLTVWSVPGVEGLAVHIQTAIIGTDTCQAYIINTLGDPKNGSGGVPYSQQPTSITGYYRYNLLGNDSALLLVMFKKAGSVVSSQSIMFRGTGSLSTFTPFSFPVSVSVVPDSVIIGVASSNVQGTGLQSGSWLELDDLEFGGTGITQPIPGGTFNNFVNQTFQKPTGWTVEPFGNAGTGVSQSTDYYQGSYSVQLTTTSSGGGNANSMITSGHFTPNNGPGGGFPFTLTHDTLVGYYKYSTPGTDTAFVNIALSAAGSMVGGAYTPLFPAGTWTEFSIPFSSFSTPDTIRFDLQSSAWNTGVPGSTFKVDYLQLKSQPLPPVQVTYMNVSEPLVTAYPNPAVDILTLKIVNAAGEFRARLFDMTGRSLDLKTSVQGAVTFPVDKLPSGLYFYETLYNGYVVRGMVMKQ